MGTALFLSNVGNRDLGKNGIPLFNAPKKYENNAEMYKKYCEEIYKEKTGKELKYNSLYEFTKELYSSGVYKDLELEPIIIKPQIEKILEFHDSVDVILFGTLQNKRHESDSFFTACIIEYLLKKEFKDKIKKIDICAITDNPSDYVEMFDYYKKVLDSFNDNNYEAIYLGITGGTSEMSFGLITNGVIKWETKAKILYKPHGSNNVNEVEIGERIFKILKKREYDILEEKHLHKLAAEIGKKYKLIDDWKVHYLMGKHYKELFDFKRALEEFEKAEKLANLKDKKKIREEIKLLSDLDRDDINSLSIKENINLYVKLINLLIDNAIRKWENGEYVDFIGRIFRIEEAILRAIVEKEFNKSTDLFKIEENGKVIKKFLGFEELLNENPDIKKYLIEKGIEIDKGVNRYSLFGILEYLHLNKYKKKNKYGLIYRFITKLNANNKTKNAPKKLEKINSLEDLRNKSIIAHGFMGVSKEDIIELYNENKSNENEIIDDLIKIKKIIEKILN